MKAAAPTGARQTVLCTAVPRGIASDGLLEIGVHLSPRLSYTGTGTGAVLGDFTDWTVWSDNAFSWQYSLNGGTSWSNPQRFTQAVDNGRMWASIFDPQLPVNSFTGAPGPTRSVAGYSYATLERGLREVYSGPTMGGSAMARAARAASAEPPYGGEATDDVAAGLGHFVSFFRPSTRRGAPVQGELLPDFHERLSLLNDHPILLQHLRLVSVLGVTAPRGTTPITKIAVRIATRTPWAVPTTIVSPPTVTTYAAGSRFAPARRRPTEARPEHDDQLRLNLGDTATFTVHSIDVDSTAAQVVGIALKGNLESPVTPPAPRSSGLTLAQRARMQVLGRKINDGHASATTLVATPGSPPDVYAEDLVVGHAFQVGLTRGASTTQWRGISNRAVTYSVRGTDDFAVTGVDEAPVTVGARRADPDDPARLLVSDVVLRWDGWSLAAPQPGRMLLQSDATSNSDDDNSGAEMGEPDLAFLRVDTSVPRLDKDGNEGRLPPLRFGNRYRLRARAVDITGGSPSFDGAPATEPATYFRFEPVPSPHVLPTPDLTRGETALRMVVRSDPAGHQDPAFTSSRTLVPPRVPVDLGLQHGVFDVDDTPSAARYAQIVRLDKTIPPSTGPDHDDTDQPRALPVTWLADPMATGVVVDAAGLGRAEASFLPATSQDGGLGADSLGAWQSVALWLEGGILGDPSQMDDIDSGDHRIVRIQLAPARTQQVVLRAQPPERRLPHHGLVDWDPRSTDAVVREVLADGIDRITPTVTVTLDHAVRQPLEAPAIQATQVYRRPGQKDPTIDVRTSVHSDSSSRLTVVASWVDEHDTGARLLTDPDYARPSTITVPRSLVLDVDVARRPVLPTDVVEPEGTLVLPDLRRRDVTLTAVSTSRYVEEFREVITPRTFTSYPPRGGRPYLDLTKASEIDVETVEVSRGGTALTRGVDYEYAVHPGTGLRTIRLGLGASTADLVVEAVRGPVTATTTSSEVVIVPSAVRATPPKPLYAVPAFEITPGALVAGGDAVAERKGSRLRIWLDRPWWSSGTGEKLAVITSHNGPVADNDDTRASQVVSLYGADAALRRRTDVNRLQQLRTGTVVAGIPLDENLGLTATLTASVAVHEVTYHPERDLYWAEVGFPDLPAGTFVRLAVARYQEHVSTVGVAPISRLSTIVTMDPVQLLPARKAVARLAGTRSKPSIKVKVTGTTHLGPANSQRPVLRVSLQRRAVPEAGTELGWDTVRRVTVTQATSGYPEATLAAPTKSRASYRLLLEEIEAWTTVQKPRPHAPLLTNASAAVNDLLGERITWIATTPIPR